ncbi:MAG: hypothetical protein CO002_03010 [Candidatus Portnoybacteria bacterium CG_4_8_14_3_um_filter_44_10]|uniref:Transcriptional regulator n=2 Tax=Candidatus Portnoyibacteriota TaxID=1817913 RepID=A0A2H0WUP5_9BACT|nr:MAG: hypothetical protein COT61_04275 [Candidatus Portnoybacteria bacterium CG09_land_8_20_14_0_10_44_13]PIW75264.1 MAG: hypothetical protein CO002_03010 [Candidatus Portnoybacteria bacterium CG_4_8_14_3_um_filter_44_10]
MPNQILEQIFNSSIRVRLFKLFLRNPDSMYRAEDVASKIQANKRVVKKQIEGLYEIGFFKKKTIRKGSSKKTAKPNRKKSGEGGKEAGAYFYVNPRFDFYEELRSLILKSPPASLIKISQQIGELGRVKLAVLSGVFINAENSRVDLFVVGDAINRRKLKRLLGDLEAEVGKSINYSVLTTDDFKYRYGMFDRFLLDILESPHKKVINKLKIE